jgi:hypothetical protein
LRPPPEIKPVKEKREAKPLKPGKRIYAATRKELMEPEETQEGQRPARRFTARIFLYLGVIGVVVIVVLAGWVVLVNKSEPEGITAIEGLSAANNFANNWHEDAVLESVIMLTDKDQVNGSTSKGWYYTYYSPSNIVNYTFNYSIYETIQVYVFSNETIISEAISGGGVLSITNWTIDSDDAYDIALNKQEISMFLSTYSAHIDSFSLANIDNRTTWSISWVDWKYNPKWASIDIDANTGEVLSVEADT